MSAGQLRVREVSYDDPDVAVLVARLQDEYLVRYGGHDDTPLTAAELRPPDGVFVVLLHAGAPVAMGGWRCHVEARSGTVPGRRPAEIKRMYVVPEARGLGLGRRLLSELEARARAAGRDHLVLETGQAQPEAIALYRSAGYVDIPAFGHYIASPLSVHLGKPLLPPDRAGPP